MKANSILTCLKSILDSKEQDSFEFKEGLNPFEEKLVSYLLSYNKKVEKGIISPNNSTLCASPKQL